MTPTYIARQEAYTRSSNFRCAPLTAEKGEGFKNILTVHSFYHLDPCGSDEAMS